jgi:hypothetical protein
MLLPILGKRGKVNRPPACSATRCNDVARIGQFRHLAGSIGFGTTPWGTMGKREPQTILKTDEARHRLELGLGGKFTTGSTAWDENWVFLEGDKLEVAVKNGRGVLNPLAGGAAAGGGTAPTYFPDD